MLFRHRTFHRVTRSSVRKSDIYAIKETDHANCDNIKALSISLNQDQLIKLIPLYCKELSLTETFKHQNVKHFETLFYELTLYCENCCHNIMLHCIF